MIYIYTLYVQSLTESFFQWKGRFEHNSMNKIENFTGLEPEEF